MKSLLSLLMALMVVAALAAAGYWAYQKNASPANQNGNVLTTSALGNPSLALTNATRYVLTVTMRQGPTLVRFQLAPEKSDTRSFSPGTYSVDGNLSDPNTDSFTAQWTFQGGGKYNATFTRHGKTVKVGGLEIVHSDNSQTSPTKIQQPEITPPKRP